MKYRLVLAIFVIFANFNFAESSTKLTVIDKESEKAVSYAKFIITKKINNKDTALTQMTNRFGTATVDVNLPFKITINQIGYAEFSKLLETESDLNIYLERKVFEIDEIVTTGQYSPQSSQKSVYKINSITEEEIESKAAPTLRELLITESNISVSQDNVTGSNLSINGVTGENIKILIDGIPVTGRVNKNIDLSQINMNNVRKVEIIEGPMSVMYGTNALGGVVNIITKDEVEDDVYVNFNSYLESVGTYNFDIMTGFKYGKSNFILSGGRNFFAGYSENKNSRSMDWNPKEQYFSDWQYNYFFQSFTLRYFGQYYYDFILDRQKPYDIYNEKAFDDQYNTNRISNSLSLKGELAKNRYFDINANYSTYDHTHQNYAKDLVTLKRELKKEDEKIFSNAMLRANYSHDNVLKSISYMAGFDFQQHTVEGGRIESGYQEVGDYAGFLSAQITQNKSYIESLYKSIVFQASLRYIYNTKYEAPLIPSLNLKVEVDDEWSVRASYAKGFRSPSLEELYFNFVDVNHNIKGNTDLKAENSDNLTLGIIFHSSSKNYSFKVEQNFFYNNIDNMIDIVRNFSTSDEYHNQNIGKFRSMGGNIALSYVRADLTSKISFAYIGRQSKSDLILDYSDVAFTPELSANVMYSLPLWQLKLNAFYKYTGKLNEFVSMTDDNNNNSYYESFADDYHMLDLSFLHNFYDDKLTLSVGAKNLLDVKKIQSSLVSTSGAHTSSQNSNIAWGRTFNFSLKLNLR